MNQSSSSQAPARRAVILRSAGVLILATLVAFLFWLWVLLQLFGLYAELNLSAWSLAAAIKVGDTQDRIRVIVAVLGAVVLTAGTWLAAMRVADDRGSLNTDEG